MFSYECATWEASFPTTRGAILLRPRSMGHTSTQPSEPIEDQQGLSSVMISVIDKEFTSDPVLER